MSLAERVKFGWIIILTHRIHGTGISAYICLICKGNVGTSKFTSPMAPMGQISLGLGYPLMATLATTHSQDVPGLLMQQITLMRCSSETTKLEIKKAILRTNLTNFPISKYNIVQQLNNSPRNLVRILHCGICPNTQTHHKHICLVGEKLPWLKIGVLQAPQILSGFVFQSPILGAGSMWLVMELALPNI